MTTKIKNRRFTIIYFLVLFFSALNVAYVLFFLSDFYAPFRSSAEFCIRDKIILMENNNLFSEIKSSSSNVEPVIFHWKEGRLSFYFKDWHEVLQENDVIIYILFYILWFLLSLGVTLLLFRIFHSIKKKGVFEKANINRIRIIASFIVLMPVAKYFSLLFFTKFSKANLILENHNIVFFREYDSTPFPLTPYFWVGLLIFAIAEIYREGIRLQTENQLTI